MRLCDESLYAVICVYVTNVMNVSLVITLECSVLGRVVNKRSCITCSSGFPFQSQPLVCLRRGCLISLIALSLDGAFPSCFAVDFSPFLPFSWLVLPSFFICAPCPVTKLVTISSRIRYPVVQLERGKVSRCRPSHFAFHEDLSELKIFTPVFP